MLENIKIIHADLDLSCEEYEYWEDIDIRDSKMTSKFTL